ncbi:MAG: Rne/Rng family ribonuclease [bacterium]
MSTELIINKDDYETRVALLESGQLVDFYLERKSGSPKHGNIYKGKVMQILPGIQAAFIDIGYDKSAFLYAGDFFDIDITDYDFFDGDEENNDISTSFTPKKKKKRKKEKNLPSIDELLRKNQEILVQIAKEPVKTKGPRVTSHISLPGRYLVYLPTSPHIGISRKIKNESERKRLKSIAMEYKPEEAGLIIRTAAENASEVEIERDIKFLVNLWNNIYKDKMDSKAPALIHEDLSISLRAIRDLLNNSIDNVIVDNKEEYDKIINFLDIQSPEFKNRVELYDKDQMILEYYDVENEIYKALDKKIWLKSGGSIVIESTEALTSIDVNTGKYVGKRNFEDTILKTNMEAAKEIAYQLRLRNIGGIIIIDFIDMQKTENKEKVYHTLEEVLKNDRVRTTINKISELGLLEMTRKRLRNSLSSMLMENCPLCEGNGLIKSSQTICFEIFRKILKTSKKTRSKKITVTVHPQVMNKIYEEETNIEKLENKIGKKILFKMQDSFHPETYEIE